MSSRTPRRTRADRCPGALRPWPAEDGLLVRLRLIGGRLPVATLRCVIDIAEQYGDGHVHLTGRANLQLRGLPGAGGTLRPDVLTALEASGLLPTRTHELVRNVLVSPSTGLAGGRADLRPVAAELDRLICASPALAHLPGRFLFVLDDGRGDLVDRSCDLGLVALSRDGVQLRIGEGWGVTVSLADAAVELLRLAEEFVARRGPGPEAAWHVNELDDPLAPPEPPDPRLPGATGPLPYGVVPGGVHVAVPDGLLDRHAVTALTTGPIAGQITGRHDLIVTPWRGVLVPEETP